MNGWSMHGGLINLFPSCAAPKKSTERKACTDTLWMFHFTRTNAGAYHHENWTDNLGEDRDCIVDA
jgi:hypothetical protein